MMEEGKLIQVLGFKPKENALGIFYKKYKGYAIEIDVEKRQFNFGNKIKAGRETTQNFSQQENWIVLECVDRLLEKGYKPKNIILEKTWKTGHGTSGRLDILVTHDDGTAYLMIECKTWGGEFDKELKKIHKDGGQLFTYFQQDKSADVLMLYASKLDGDNIQFKNEIIKIEEHYREAGNVADVFDRWNKVTNANGIFDDWVKPYLFESKKLLKKDLTALNEEASKSLFNKFASILRKHSVSDKSNSFNVIFDLFLAKLWDEKKEAGETLDFQWKEKDDDPVSFQYRLLDLYRDGMDDFLKKEVFGLKDSDFNANTDEELKKIKKKVLMLEKVFSIKSVIDEESFEENHKVLKEVVQLLQGYQIRYPRKQQHLSDFFERLLTTGLKQEVGQFFTPPPITRFIVKSLPIQQMLMASINQKSPKLPAVIDYAVGSGHFLTEVMEEYQSIINQLDISNFKTDAKKHVQKWRIDEYEWASQYIYGVDKDYRLVKVAKVGCYFYGDGLAQVIYGDGLDNFENAKSFRGLLKDNATKPQFQLVLSNPPYAVEAFKTTLNAAHANKDFKLFNSLTDRSSEIECLFVERTKHLLKNDGIAAIILPSSILSNTSVLHTKTRAIILKYFDIVAITELGSNTFMATGTNTVILFLKRRNNADAYNFQESIKKLFENKQDVTINGIEHPLQKYIAHVWEGVSFDDYKTLLDEAPNETIKAHEIFREYGKKIKAKNEREKWTEILALEQDKLLYFILTYKQKIVLVKTGSKTKEKQFLGYEFSNRRGNEGIHPIQRGKPIDECTRLYDAHTFENIEKASTYIYKAFNGNFDLEIDDNLKENVSYQNLVDMLTFDRVNFEKNISLSVRKKVKIESKWGEEILDNLAMIQSGLWIGKKGNLKKVKVLRNTNFKLNNGKLSYDDVAEIEVELEQLETRKLQFGDIILEKSGGSDTQAIGRVALFDKKNDEIYSYSNFCSRIRVINEKKINAVYLWLLLNKFYNDGGTESLQNGIRLLNIDLVGYKRVKIPLPPLDIQQKIVDEIAVLEQQELNFQIKINSYKENINNSLQNLLDKATDSVRLSDTDIFETKIGKRILKSEISNQGKYPVYSANVFRPFGFINKELLTDFSTSSVVWGIDGDWMVNVIPKNKPFYPTDHCGYLRIKRPIAKARYIAFCLDKEGRYIGFSRTKRASIDRIQGIKIPLPKMEEQEKVVSEIEKWEHKITTLKNQIAKIPKQKESILKNHLE